jgi:hypothetical protein
VKKKSCLTFYLSRNSVSEPTMEEAVTFAWEAVATDRAAMATDWAAAGEIWMEVMKRLIAKL